MSDPVYHGRATAHRSSLTDAGDELVWKSADELRVLFEDGSVSPVEVARAHLERIHQHDDGVNAFVTVTDDVALSAARAAERARSTEPRSRTSPLLGVPFALKDLVDTAGIRTARGSLRTSEVVPSADSPLAARLLATGAVLIGKTTTSEAGWKADAGNRVNGAVRNPHAPHHTAGGSSGGAAAAVAAAFVPVAQGGDGAGSVRIPASFCGVVGIKPSTGVIPYYPPTPLGTMVANGPLARTVVDAALLLDAMSGPDPHDASTLHRPAGGYRAACDRPPKPLRIAYLRTLGGRAPEDVVAEHVDRAVVALQHAGHTVEVLDDTPGDRYDMLRTIWSTGFASLFPDAGDDLDPGLAEVIRSAADVSGADVAAAHRTRRVYMAEMAHLLSPYDIAVTATSAVPPFEVGTDGPATVRAEPMEYLQWAWLTYTFNLTEHPAVSLPCGVTADGLPIGIQLVGHHGRDHDLVAAAAALEHVVRVR